MREHQTRLALSFDFDDQKLWKDEAAVAALGPALARRPELRQLSVHSLECVCAHVSQAGMLGNFAEYRQALEPAAADLLGFVAGRMPALESLTLDSGFRGNRVVQLPRWVGCLRSQLRSLDMTPVRDIFESPDLLGMAGLTRLSLHLRGRKMGMPPGIAPAACQPLLLLTSTSGSP